MDGEGLTCSWRKSRTGSLSDTVRSGKELETCGTEPDKGVLSQHRGFLEETL